MVCKCSLVERLDLLPIAVLLMSGGKLPAQRAKSAHFVGHLPVNPNMMKLVLLQQLFWWVSSSRDICSPEYVLDFRHNTGSWPLRGLTACLFSLRRESKQYLPKVDTSFI